MQLREADNVAILADQLMTGNELEARIYNTASTTQPHTTDAGIGSTLVLIESDCWPEDSCAR